MTSPLTPEEQAKLLEEILSDVEGVDGLGPADPRWDALAAEDLSEHDRSELAQLAMEDGEAALAMEAFSPLGDEFEAKMAARLEASIAVVAPQAEPAPAAVEPPEVSWAERLRTWFRPAVLVPALAAAALVVVALPDTPPVPGYELELLGQMKDDRGPKATTGVDRFSGESQIVVSLRPETTVSGTVDVAVWMQRDGSWSVLEEQASTETGLIEVRIDTLGLPKGKAELAVLVGRDVDDCTPSLSCDGVQVLRKTVVIVEP